MTLGNITWMKTEAMFWHSETAFVTCNRYAFTENSPIFNPSTSVTLTSFSRACFFVHSFPSFHSIFFFFFLLFLYIRIAFIFACEKKQQIKINSILLHFHSCTAISNLEFLIIIQLPSCVYVCIILFLSVGVGALCDSRSRRNQKASEG